MQLSFAPLEGITGYRFRNAHAKWFGAADRYFTPFLTPNQTYKLTAREKNDVLPAHNAGLCVVPQLLTNHAEHALWALSVLGQQGYGEVNFNFGCPSGTVVVKRKGAGMLADVDALDRFLEAVCKGFDGKISVKTRLGLEQAEEFAAILEVYNRYPLCEVIIHPRVQQDFYNGHADWQAFGQALEVCRHPVCYNGDLFTVDDYARFCQAFPTVSRVMLGRGWVANPDLGNQIRGKGMLDKTRLRGFHDELYAAYCETLSGEVPVLFKMKELWFYQHVLFENGKKVLKKIRKAKRLHEYEAAVEEMFGQSLLSNVGYRPGKL